MRLLVTGAGGMLGGDVVAAAEAAGHEVVALARGDLDVTDRSAVERELGAHRPEVVVNCAAYTDVDGSESEPEPADAINVAGAGNVAQAAAGAGAAIVHVSSDYVFDGHASRPYLESDATHPLSAYGRSKLAGEQRVRDAGADHAIVRSAWLFGAGGHNFVETMLALAAEREEVSVVTDQVGCPTWTGHLAPALIELAERRGRGLFHVAGAGACSWHEFAVEIFRQAGVACAVRAAVSAELRRRAPRPAYSALASEREDAPVLPDWRAGLAGYLAARAALGRSLA